MSTFPFLSVPFLAQNEILKNMELRDLFLFSTLSKRSHRAVKSASIYLPHLKISIIDNYGNSFIRLETATGNAMLFDTDYDFWMKTFNVSCPRFEIKNVKWILSGGFWTVYSTAGCSDAAFEDLIRYIMDLFEKKKLEVKLNAGNIEKFRLWNVTKTVDVLKIGTKMSASETKFVEEELKVAESIYTVDNPYLIPF